jgi:hypothetical protein
MEPPTSTQPDIRYATTSGPDGRFSLTETVSQTSAWSVDTSANDSYWESWFPDYTSASYNWIDGVSKTRVTGFSLPARDEAHLAYNNGMRASGAVQRWNGSTWVGLPYGWIQLYYRPKGSTAWRKDNGGQTDASGGFSVIAGVRLGTADWQVRVRPSADTLTSTSASTVTNTITDRTHFASASIQRGSSGSTITGQVTDWYSGQVSFSSLRGLTLKLYYRPRNSTTWHYYKTTTVGSSGWVRFSEAAGSGGGLARVGPGAPAQQPRHRHRHHDGEGQFLHVRAVRLPDTGDRLTRGDVALHRRGQGHRLRYEEGQRDAEGRAGIGDEPGQGRDREQHEHVRQEVPHPARGGVRAQEDRRYPRHEHGERRCAGEDQPRPRGPPVAPGEMDQRQHGQQQGHRWQEPVDRQLE